MRTQLKNWKRNKYEYYGEVYETDPIKAWQLISSHLPDDHSVFLNNVIEKMTKTPTSKNKKPSWFAEAATLHQYIKEMLPKMMDDPFKSIFVDILNMYVDIGVSVFP